MKVLCILYDDQGWYAQKLHTRKPSKLKIPDGIPTFPKGKGLYLVIVGGVSGELGMVTEGNGHEFVVTSKRMVTNTRPTNTSLMGT